MSDSKPDPKPDPIVVTASFVPREGRKDDVTAALSAAIAEVHEEPGCQYYALHDAPDGTLFLIEKWSSVAELDTHGGSPAVGRLNAALDGLLEQPVVVTRLAPVPAGTGPALRGRSGQARPLRIRFQ